MIHTLEKDLFSACEKWEHANQSEQDFVVMNIPVSSGKMFRVVSKDLEFKIHASIFSTYCEKKNWWIDDSFESCRFSSSECTLEQAYKLILQ